MVLPILCFALEPAAERHRRMRLMRMLTVAWLVLIAIAAGFWMAGHKGVLLAPAIIIVAALAFYGLRHWANQWEPDWHEIARSIEQRHPDLHALLLTAVEQRPDPRTGEFHFLQQRVIQSAIAESRRRPWIDAVPQWRLAGAMLLQCILIGGLLFLLTQVQRSALADRRTQATAQAASVQIEVTPGDTEVERGTGLVVLAKFTGEVPSAATLILQPRSGTEQRIELTKNMDDPVFGGALPEITDDLEYRIAYSDTETQPFQVKVFEHPRLERADARLVYPDYTKLPEKEIPDTRRVTAVQGTKLDLSLALNKPVKNAKLVGKEGAEIPLTVEPDKAVARLSQHEVQKSGSYTLHLEDAEGRNSKVPAQFAIEALPNRRPEVKLALPKGDQRVSPLQEVGFQQEVWDDFGIVAYGLSYTLPSGETKEMVLGRDVPADRKVQGSLLLKLEEVGVKPDELLSWMAWAEDVGPDGKPRRTMTDMYFAEVRPFEEIFRRGDDQSGGEAGGQGGNGSPATKLAQLQKQIVTATWNLLRLDDLTPGTPTFEKYQKDEPVVLESQKEALKQAQKLAEGVEQPKSQALVEAVTQQMQQAVEHLEAAKTSIPRLGDALQSERGAYNALLKLASHEFNVRRNSQQSSSGGQQSGDRQQQLDQLDLKDERKRYETKSEAAPQQNEEQREQLAVLNRLKELAQRQQDINERLKELQTALQEAKTEEEKEEARRQLKRLREEEQQLLADMDETRQRMDSSQNPSQFSEDRRRMEQTRNEAQQAAEAMERQDPSAALASGTRAERELEQMRDEFRKKTSGQFREEIRDLRADARELSEKQKELGEQLNESQQQQEAGTPTRRSLDGSSPREQLAEQFNRQGEQLKDVQERMQQLSEQAEAAEPLLSRELYDALRKTAQAGTQETLERAGQLARRGFAPQARDFEEKARQEIEELKGGVERAAESVLGDEAEALRLARAELDALTNQLNRELAQADPNGRQISGERNEGKSGDRQQSGGDQNERQRKGDAGDPQGSQQQPADPQQNGRGQANRPGERREGQQPQSGEMPGQQQAEGERRQPGQQSGEGRGEGNDSNREGEQPGEGNNRGEARLADNSERSGRGNRPGQQPGQAQGQPGENPRGGENQQGNPSGQPGARSGDQSGSPDQQPGERPEPSEAIRNLLSLTQRERGGIREGGGSGGGDQGGGAEFQEGPIRGEGFVQWSDRLRNVEEMLDDPKLRSQVAQVREVARGMRAEFKRHSKEPEWEVVRSKISRPLAELRNRVTEELARRESRESLVPIDRDPVPNKYVEHVRRYYEELGRSR